MIDVYNEQFSYIANVSRDACISMEIAGTHITGLLFITVLRPIVLTVHVNNDSAYHIPPVPIPILIEIRSLY